MLKHMSNHKLTPGLAFDLTTTDPDDGMPWDLSLEEKRVKVLKKVRRDKPLFVIGSPPCARWCSWRGLSDVEGSPTEVKEDHERARIHLQFAAQVYREQVENGRFFLHEHPEFGTSWKEPCIEELLEMSEVSRVRADQCQYGQSVRYGQLGEAQ